VAELARTAVARACIATLTCRRAGQTSDVLTIVRIRDDGDGQLTFTVDGRSPVVRDLAVRKVASLAVPAQAPFAALHITGTTSSAGPAPDEVRTYALSPLSVRFVGAVKTPVPVTDYRSAQPDPLWREAPGVVAHLEHAHSADLLACIRAHGIPRAEAVVPRSLDRYGLGLAVVTGTGVGTARLPFPGGPVSSLTEVGLGLRAALTCRCGGSLRPTAGGER
jgi:hypothetical protein